MQTSTGQNKRSSCQGKTLANFYANHGYAEWERFFKFLCGRFCILRYLHCQATLHYYFNTKHDVFLTLAKYFFFLNLTNRFNVNHVACQHFFWRLLFKQTVCLTEGWRLDCVCNGVAAEQLLNEVEYRHTTGRVRVPAEENIFRKCAAGSLKTFKDDESSVNIGQCTFHFLFYGKESKFGMC